jgi:hypothetical protein
MDLFVKLVIVGLIFYTIFFYIRTKVFLNKVVKERKNIKQINKKSKKIIIVIPVLREQKCIENTIRYFNAITNDIPIILITTQREIKENLLSEKTTQDIIKEKIITKYKDVYWVNYPYTKGYMSDQLNYMIENLENILNKKIDLDKTYLALYNADSRPNENTFKEISQKIENNDVVQQYSYCMKNYEEIKGVLRGFSIYQSNFELKTGVINSFFKSKILYTHVVGHGLIINMKLLKTFGNFNTEFWCEDIYLGIQLKFNNIRITPLVTLENMETPDKLGKIIKQNSVWFKTTSQFWKIYKDIVKRKQFKNRLNGLLGVANELRCAINWISFPIVLLASIIISINIKNYLLLLLIIISYDIYIIINTVCTINIINKLDNKKYKITIKLIINVLIATTISNIGPLYSIIFNKKEKYKTER